MPHSETPPQSYIRLTKKSPRQGRVHFTRKPKKLYSFDQIQHAFEAMSWIYDLDFLTPEQLAVMLFWDETKDDGTVRGYAAARHAVNEFCLRRLKDRGLIEVIPAATRINPKWLKPLEFQLITRKGIVELRDEFGVDAHYRNKLRQSAQVTFEHTYAVNTAIAALVAATRRRGGVVERCIAGRNLTSMVRSSRQETLLGNIEPDAVLIVCIGDERQALLLEADRRTESIQGNAINRFEAKIPKYSEFFATRCAGDPLFAGLPQPKVVVVATGEQRVRNLKEATFAAGGRRAYWFTCFDWIKAPYYDAGGAVWLVPTLEGYRSLFGPIS